MRTVDTPRRILAGKAVANDVELALILGAITKEDLLQRDIEPIVVLFQNQTYFAWRLPDRSWGAVNLTLTIGEMNIADAELPFYTSSDFISLLTPKLYSILDNHFVGDGDGVYLDMEAGLFAFGVKRGADHYRIYPMR